MRRLIVAVLFAVVIALGVIQLILPGIAARQLRHRLERYGTVLAVQVHAFPAIELLWHHAERVVVRMANYHSSAGTLGSQLAQAGNVGTLDASAGELQAGLLTLRDATLTKR